MVAGGKVPTLGGETRELTIWFSDIADFASLSEHMPPAQLVRFLNRYLSEMTDLLDRHGGFVDKYIGDAILAVFGAPVDDPDHALHAVEAALACRNRLEEMSREFSQMVGRPLSARIGINSGQAIVGNIGSRRRFNYTVMGDAVNLASRLEGANKIYGTDILVSDTAMAGCGDRVKFREIDLVRVVGRESPVRIFEPFSLTGAEAPTPESVAQDEQAVRFAAALGAFREQRFAAAADAFAELAEIDAVAAYYVDRARALAESPPDAGWDRVTILTEK
jgi:adenylate cyclase